MLPLPLQQIHFVHINRLLISEEGDQYAETNSRFGRRISNHKNGEHLAVQTAPVTRESNQVQVYRIEDQFNRHQHHNHVPASEHTDHAQQKQGRAQDQIVQSRDVEHRAHIKRWLSGFSSQHSVLSVLRHSQSTTPLYWLNAECLLLNLYFRSSFSPSPPRQ